MSQFSSDDVRLAVDTVPPQQIGTVLVNKSKEVVHDECFVVSRNIKGIEFQRFCVCEFVCVWVYVCVFSG